MTSPAAPPTLTVASPDRALDASALRAVDGAALSAFLLARRWFGAKAGPPREARVEDVIPLPWDGDRLAIARLRVVTAAGVAQRYQLPLAARTDRELGDAKPRAVVARFELDGGGDGGAIFDATEDATFLRHLADAFARGERIEGRGARGRVWWIAEGAGDRGLVVPPDTSIRVGSAEQSNTSVIIGEEAILKMFRRLEPGENPDLELTRFLGTRAAFAHVPVLLGAIRFEDEGGEVAVGGMLQEYMPRSTDAWGWMLERGASYFAAPRGSEPKNDLLGDAERLGRVTRELHEALASDDEDPAMAPELAEPEDVERWAQHAQRAVRDALALLERQVAAGTMKKERLAEAQVLVRRRDHYVSSVDDIVDTVSGDAGLRIRTHGDYHLGQVLRTASDDFAIIDFEGEPLRPLEERREKTSPLRDVAGMLRSFAYAAATLGMRQEGGGADVATREIRMARWERDMREAFLRGYLAPPSDAAAGDDEEPGILPEDPTHVRALLALFETEKVFYELSYELNNRPDWAWIPVRGISKLLVG